MRLLLDTCVLLEIRKPKPNKKVVDVIKSMSNNDIFLSTVTIGEITKGISLLKAGKRKNELQKWLQVIEKIYGHRILDVDIETSRIWGELTAKAQQAGKIISAMDGLIAATGLRHGLHIVTRNISDFEVTGVMLIDPWESKH